MGEQSRSDELLTFCMALSTEDCQEIFRKSLRNPPPRYNALKVVRRMTSGRSDLKCFEDDFWQAKFCSNEEKLLNVVAKRSGIVLHAFLLALKIESMPFYMLIEQNIRETFNRKPCTLVYPGTDDEQIDRAKLQNILSDKQQKLLICPTCKRIMSRPVLMHCLHSCCNTCMDECCAQCHGDVKHDCPPNYHLHFEIAYVTDQRAFRQSQSNNEHRASETGQCFIPMCKVHNAQLKLWCKSCDDFRCEIYASHQCSRQNPRHEMLSPKLLADVLHPVLEPFRNATETSGDAMKSVLDSQFRHAQSVLERNRVRLLKAAEDAFTNARKKMEEIDSEQHKVVDRLTEQLNQAGRYVQSLHNEDWHIMDQRKLLFNQLTLLLLVTQGSLPSLTLEQCQSFGFPVDYKAVKSNGFLKRLVIRCLDDNYDLMPVAKELIGQPDLSAPDLPFIRDTHSVGQQIAELSSIEIKKPQLDCQLQLDEIQKKYKDAVAKVESMEVELQLEGHETDAATMVVKLQVNERATEELQINTNGTSYDVYRVNAADVIEENETMRDILRTHWIHIKKSLVRDNVLLIADYMFVHKAINKEELSAVNEANGCYAVSQLLEVVYARGAMGVHAFRQALQAVNLPAIAEWLKRTDCACPSVIGCTEL